MALELVLLKVVPAVLISLGCLSVFFALVGLAKIQTSAARRRDVLALLGSLLIIWLLQLWVVWGPLADGAKQPHVGLAYGSIVLIAAICLQLGIRQQTKRLAQSLRRLALKRDLLDLSPDAVLIRRLNGPLTFWSRGAEALYGWSRQLMLGRRYEDYTKPSYPDQLDTILETLRATGRWSGEVTQHTADGRQIQVFSRWSLTSDPLEHEEFILETNTDMTAYKEANQALVDSEQRFRELADSMPQIVWWTDANGQPAYLNARWFDEVSARGSSEHGRLDWAHAVHPDDVDALQTQWAECLRRKEVFQAVLRLRHHRDGEYHWYLSRQVPVIDATGTVSKWVGTSTNIDDAKKLELKLRASEELTRTIIESVEEGVFALSAAGTILSWNPAAERIFGYTAAAILGRHVHTILPPYTLSPEAAMLLRAEGISLPVAPEKRGWTIAVQGQRQNGTYVPLELSLSEARPSRDDAPGAAEAEDATQTELMTAKLPQQAAALAEPLVYIGVCRNTSDRRKAEEEQLARRVAEAANAAKSEFLATMSHEIRTPINGIVGMTELALGTKLDEQQREYLSLARTSACHLMTLISDVLDFSKVEAGKMELRLAPFDVRDCLFEHLQPLAVEAYKKGLELVVSIAAEVPKQVVSDSSRLMQVVVNLVNNAIKFTAQGEVALTVGWQEAPAHTADDPRAQLVVTVRDTGRGIPPSRQHEIFEPFVQAISEKGRPQAGTGLGLAICARLTSLLGGELTLVSSLGQGSAFTVQIPVGAVEADSNVGLPAVGSLAGLHLLLLVDQACLRQSLATSLLAWGLQVTARSTAGLEQAEGEAAGGPYDLAILDLGSNPTHDAQLWERRLCSCREAYVRYGVVGLVSPWQGGVREDHPPAAGSITYLAKPVKPCLLWALLLRLAGLAEAHKLPVARQASPAWAGKSGLRVLLAEDSAINQRVAQDFLKAWGHTVSLAQDGRQALDLLSREQFDLVLMDLRMPELDGSKVTQEVRRREQQAGTGHLPIIALTAQALAGDREHCLEAGFDEYLAKPYRSHELQEKMMSVYARYRSSAKPSPSLQLGKPAAAFDPPIRRPVLAFDRQRALENFEQDSGLLAEALNRFRQEAHQQQTQVQAALWLNDIATAEALTHKMLGSLAWLGAPALYECTKRLNGLLRAGDLAQAQACLPKWEAELRAFDQLIMRSSGLSGSGLDLEKSG